MYEISLFCLQSKSKKIKQQNFSYIFFEKNCILTLPGFESTSDWQINDA